MGYRYIGNKDRLIKWLINIIKDLVEPGSTIVDPMCGTATVSEALRFAGFKVIASDILTFATYHAYVRLKLPKPPSFNKLDLGSYLDILWYLQNLEPIKGFFYNEYSPAGIPSEDVPPRKYFTPDNAGKIDAILECIREWNNNGLLSQEELMLLMHDLVLATNSIANIAGTYGHYRSKLGKSSRKPLVFNPTKFYYNFRTDHVVRQGYAEELAPTITADLCYIDPPYMKRQYAANYHILETISRGEPTKAIGVSGLRPWRDQYSNFCSKIKVADAFRKIIGEMDCPQFLISYSEDGLLPLEDLENLFSEFGTVQVMKKEYPRFKSNASTLNNTLKEYLFYVKKDS